MYLLQGISFHFSLDEVTSVQPLPTAAAALVVRSGQRSWLTPRGISAMTELVDRAQPDLTLRRHG